MSWVRIDEYAPYHPKVVAAGLGGFGLFCASLCYANKFLTDGFIPVGTLSAVYPGEKWSALVKLAVKLVEVGLWEKRDDGWLIHDYHQYQPTKAEVLEERRQVDAWHSAGGKARASMASRIKGRFMRDESSNGTSKLPAETPAATPAIDQREAPATAPASTSIPTAPAPTTEKEGREALSGSRPTTSSFHRESREILEWLNDKTGKHFEFIDANLGPIQARLREGREAWQLKKVVSVKAKAWATDEKMREFLRPATLFNKTKCAQYIGELPAPGSEP